MYLKCRIGYQQSKIFEQKSNAFEIRIFVDQQIPSLEYIEFDKKEHEF